MEHVRWRHVHDHVAVEEPISGPVRRPRHIEHMANINEFGDGLAALLSGVALVTLAITYGVDIEKETVEMHAMWTIGGIDYAPMDRLAGAVGDMLGKGPRLPVYGRDFLADANCAFRPEAKNENPVVGFRSGWIHYERAVEQSFCEIAEIERMVPSRRPIKVCPGFTRDELHIARFAGRDAHCVLRISRMPVQAVNLGCERQRITNARVDLCPLRHADQRPGGLRRVSLLGKEVYFPLPAALIFRIPDSLAQFEMQ